MKKIYKKIIAPIIIGIIPLMIITSCSKQQDPNNPNFGERIDYRNNVGNNTPTPTPSNPDSTLTAVNNYKQAHAEILAKTQDSVALEDETKVNAALEAYNNFEQNIKGNLVDQKTLLDQLVTKINKLKQNKNSNDNNQVQKKPINDDSGSNKSKETNQTKDSNPSLSNAGSFKVNSVTFDFNDTDHTSLGIVVTFNNAPSEAEKQALKLHISYPKDKVDEDYDGIFNANLWHTKYKDNKVIFELYDLVKNFDYSILKLEYNGTTINLPSESITFKAGVKPENIYAQGIAKEDVTSNNSDEHEHHDGAGQGQNHDQGNNSNNNSSNAPIQNNLNLEKVEFVADDSDKSTVSGNLTLTLNTNIISFNASKLEIRFDLKTFSYEDITFKLSNNILSAYIYDLPKDQTITITSLKYNNQDITLNETKKTFLTNAPQQTVNSEVE
ncbi:hypothetical protein [Mycoplasmopsis bovirhinis]|uniref:Lipoprotein n=1 Tax=Mycoplasmopsis bovirhinis TaxID=29553 RepID=A0A449AF84_9BACT|nr:hypothetical protein [Mycoplasmopsis bovirhinis]VEU63637.1 Uncharacterised protein [Mycoplasmopsis bovirhinis]